MTSDGCTNDDAWRDLFRSYNTGFLLISLGLTSALNVIYLVYGFFLAIAGAIIIVRARQVKEPIIFKDIAYSILQGFLLGIFIVVFTDFFRQISI